MEGRVRQRLRASIESDISSSSTTEDNDNMASNTTAASAPLLGNLHNATPHNSLHLLQEIKADGRLPLNDTSETSDTSLHLQTDANAAEVAEEQILKVIDRLEDEWEEQMYEELIPLEVKLAMEEKIFGWSHLVSAFFGYAFFTAGAFGLAFGLLWQFTHGTTWGHWIRGPLSLFAAWTSFRMVRRRRKVWFRAAYGTKAYRADGLRRRKEVEEADKSSWLGRLRKLSKQRKVARQMQRAETNFNRHHERRLLRAQSQPVTEYSSFKTKRRLSFRTDPLPIMTSIQQDQITFCNGQIQNVLYAHGGFFGAAPFLLANPHWIAILRSLMPDVYVEISRRVKAEPRRLIHWAENNPVVAAYGTAHELEYNGYAPSLEWDVFLDPALVKRVQVVITERAKFLQQMAPNLNHNAGERNGKNDNNDDEFYQRLMTMSQRHQHILRYYDKELQRRAEALVEKMLIAHGSLTQLALEQTGFAKNYNYSRVKRTRRTLGGGIYARQWMAVYAESLRIGVAGSDAEGSPKKDSVGLTSLNVSETCPNTTLAESVAVVKDIAKGADSVGLVLDLKSRHVSKPVLGCVVDCLREMGFRVEGMGTFVVDDVRDVSHYCSEPVKELLFFHSAGDMQQACHNGQIRSGDTVFFNAGSLLWDPNNATDSTSVLKNFVRTCCAPFDPEDAKRNYRILSFGRTTDPNVTEKAGLLHSSTIEAYKERFNLSIGLYVQEFAIDEVAVDIFVKLVNESPHVYDLGLSWGGVNGITLRGIQPHRFTSTDGFWNQRYMAKTWDSALVPPPPPIA